MSMLHDLLHGLNGSGAPSTDPVMHSGVGAPTSAIGKDGDYYRRHFPILRNLKFYPLLKKVASNNAYINTGIYAAQDVDVVAEIDRDVGLAGVVGVRTGSFISMQKAIYMANHTDKTNGVSCSKTGLTTLGGAVVSVSGKSVRRTKTMPHPNGSCVYSATIDESSSSLTVSAQSGTWSSEMPICILAFYEGTTLKTSSNPGAVGRVTIYEKGIPVADFLPCKDENDVPCMYDTVSGTCFYNDNTDPSTYFETVGDPITFDPLGDALYVRKSGEWVPYVWNS